jgi:hypothetical protein
VSIETQIVDAIVAVVTAVPGINYVSFDKIKLATSDFQAHELPAVQLWDNGQLVTHERGRVRKDWNLSLELIMKSEITGTVDQKALFELRRTIDLALWAQPNLGIPGVIHLIYTGNISDLHLLEPFYIARIDFTVQFYDALTGSC